MGLPNILTGVSYAGKDSRSVTLQIKQVDVERQRNTQAVYEDETGKIWFVKELHKEDALRETIAGNYFQFLTKKEFAPDTRYLVGANGKYYVMSAFTALKEMDPAQPPNNLALLISASFAIHDGDFLPKNAKSVNGDCFRIDFGAALSFNETDNQRIPFITSVDQLRTGFQTRSYNEKLHNEDFIAAAHYLRQRNLNDFPWQEWISLASSDEASELLKSRHYSEERIRLYCAHILDNKNTYDEKLIAQAPKEEITKLTEFYKLLMQENLAERDYIFHRVDPLTLAYRHIEHVKKYGKVPEMFEKRILQAHQKKSQSSHASLFSNLKLKDEQQKISQSSKDLDKFNKLNELDSYCLEQFDAKKLGIDIKRFEPVDLSFLSKNLSNLLKGDKKQQPSQADTSNATLNNPNAIQINSKQNNKRP